MPGLVDVVLGYDCNLACDYCTISPAMRARGLKGSDVLRALQTGRGRDYDRVAFTGGEPTIRRDLVALVRRSRELGYDSVKVQSNGLMFTPGNVARLTDAGANLLHVSIHAADRDLYHQTVRREGTYELMCAGLEAAVQSGAEVVVDTIVREHTFETLVETIEWIHARGARQVDLWFVSLTDANRFNVSSMPAMTQAVPYMRKAFARGRELGMRIRSLHVPRCLLEEDAGHAFDPGADRVMVVTPDSIFELKDSLLAGRMQVPACSGCEHELICPGVRPDYIERYGDGEFASARGQEPTLAGATRLPVIAS